jgi:hypothetical protein
MAGAFPGRKIASPGPYAQFLSLHLFQPVSQLRVSTQMTAILTGPLGDLSHGMGPPAPGMISPDWPRRPFRPRVGPRGHHCKAV